MLSRQNDRHGGGYKTNSQRAYSQCRSKADSLLFAYRYFGCVVIRYGIAYRYYSLRAWRFIKMYSVNPAVYAMQYKYDRGRVSCYPLFIQNISLFIVVVVMMIICTFLKNVAAAFAVISVCSGVSIWLYTSISDISAYNILKYINFCCFISPHQLFYRYYHLNIFGKPVSALTVCVITTVIILIMALLIYFAVYCSRRAISASGKISEIFSYITVKRKLSANFVVNEVYKTAIAGKALLVLVVVAVIGFCNYQNMSAGYDSEQKRYDSYVAQIGGEVTDETLLFWKMKSWNLKI